MTIRTLESIPILIETDIGTLTSAMNHKLHFKTCVPMKLWITYLRFIIPKPVSF